MTLEILSNASQSTLAGSMTAGQTTCPIQPGDAGKFPAAGNYRLVVITAGVPEVMLVTGGQGTATLTVTRAVETGGGLSNAASHNSGDLVAAAMTVGGYQAVFPTKIGEVLLAAPAASIDFSSIPQTFRHLELIFELGCDQVAVQQIQLQVNGDTGANYVTAVLAGQNATVVAASAFTVSSIHIGNAGGTDIGHQGHGRITLSQYRGRPALGNLDVWGTYGLARAAGTMELGTVGGQWVNVADVNAIHLFLPTGLFRAGGVATLYGLP